MPDHGSTRYESYDRPVVEVKIKQLCAGSSVVYANADRDAAKPSSRLEPVPGSGCSPDDQLGLEHHMWCLAASGPVDLLDQEPHSGRAELFDRLTYCAERCDELRGDDDVVVAHKADVPRNV
jgi:hypothetical protein